MKKNPYAPLGDQLNQPPQFWRSLEHKNADTSVTQALDVEFPNGAAPDQVDRRQALKLAGASLALSAAVGCDVVRRPVEEILPFVRTPEHMIPGVRMLYATAMPRSEGALGLLVEAHEGRPTKIEGNPNHPASLGASDIWAQAEVLKLYDPDRARAPMKGGAASSWGEWDGFAKSHFERLVGAQGKGLAILLEEDAGPTVERLLRELVAKAPETKIYRWDPLAPDHALQAAELAYGPGARVHYDLEKASLVFSLDSDFLSAGPDHLRLARQFGRSRAVKNAADTQGMHRLYAAEAAFTVTGSNADHRLRIASGEGIDLLKALASQLVAQHGVDLGEIGTSLGGVTLDGNAQKFVQALAKDMASRGGGAVVLVGERQPVAAHALAYAINTALGAAGRGMLVTQGEATPRAGMQEQLVALTQALGAGAVDTLVMLDVNPAYTAPGALRFGEAMAKAKTVIHAGVLVEETGARATWHLPLAHFLESWGDTRAWDGTASIVQPLIMPIFGARATASIVAQLSGVGETLDRKLVEATWRGAGMLLENGKAWRKAVHDGVIANTARAASGAMLKRPEVAAAVTQAKGVKPSKDAVELVALFGHALDGRLSNVSWVMELPDGMSKLVWDNALLVSPHLAKELGLESAVKKNAYVSDVVEISVGDRKLSAPTFVLPGLNPNTVVLTHGFGRAQGHVSSGVGVAAAPLLATRSNVEQGVRLQKTSETRILCSTQDHFSVPGNPYKERTFVQMLAEPQGAPERMLGLGERPHFREGPAIAFAKGDVSFARRGDTDPHYMGKPGAPTSPAKPKQMTDEVVYTGQQWGMTIDLSSCIGCNACAVACVAENNIPAVGREQALLGREMHWIRIDRYFTGDIDTPSAVHQPVACMHCENAPCEPVCPVGATTHDEEGLNSMAYNRCIGTRYCANNCPFKVRRFNYLDFTHSGNVYVEPQWKERMKSLQLQRNPDVTVRYRGIMEKCTYCTQRIEEAKVAAKRAGKDRKALVDGAVTPACAQACPTEAITFGNINDPESRVAKNKVSPRNYEMLQELNVRPRTSFLARVRNVNEELG